MKKSILSLTLLFALFLVGPVKAMISTKDMEDEKGGKPTYSQFCIGVENQVEGEKMFVKTLYVPDGEILETTHKQDEEIEFGKTFTVKLKIKDRPGMYLLDYIKEFKKKDLSANITIGNEERDYFLIPHNPQNDPRIADWGKCKDKSKRFVFVPIIRPTNTSYGFIFSMRLCDK